MNEPRYPIIDWKWHDHHDYWRGGVVLRTENFERAVTRGWFFAWRVRRAIAWLQRREARRARYIARAREVVD